MGGATWLCGNSEAMGRVGTDPSVRYTPQKTKKEEKQDSYNHSHIGCVLSHRRAKTLRKAKNNRQVGETQVGKRKRRKEERKRSEEDSGF